MSKLKRMKLNTNFVIAYYVTQLNLAMCRNVTSVKIVRTEMGLRLTHLLYKQGVFRSYKILPDVIQIFLKYDDGEHVIYKLSLVSKPSKRVYLTLSNLSRLYNQHDFAGFYVISTVKGLFTSDICLLYGHISGEILLKVEV